MQPYPGAPNAKKVHQEINALSKEQNGKVFGLASLNPHMDDAEFDSQVDELFRDNGFVGIKMHTIGHAMNPMGADGKKLFDIAKKYNKPLMVHTGHGIPFSMPSRLTARAKQYPDVKIVVAHAGSLGPIFDVEYTELAESSPSVYLETSWSTMRQKKLFMDKFPDRVIMGSDSTYNTASEVVQFKSMEKDGYDVGKALYENAKRVFKL